MEKYIFHISGLSNYLPMFFWSVWRSWFASAMGGAGGVGGWWGSLDLVTPQRPENHILGPSQAPHQVQAPDRARGPHEPAILPASQSHGQFVLAPRLVFLIQASCRCIEQAWGTYFCPLVDVYKFSVAP